MRRPCSSRRAALAVVLSLAAVPGAATRAQERIAGVAARLESPRSTLWVGNSFFYANNSMHSHVEALARAADATSPYSAVSATISGAGIAWHDIESYLRPRALGSFRFAAGNRVVFEPQGQRFDSVILMDCSQCPVHPQLREAFHDAMRSQAEVVRRHGARPILFMSWAYRDRPEMTELLAREYRAVGAAIDAPVIPAGLAFANALAQRPDIRLHQDDLRHPTMRGTYLAACTVFAATTGRSPVGNPYTAGIDAQIAHFLQTIAWETVQEDNLNR
jgi:hypothetical protein